MLRATTEASGSKGWASTQSAQSADRVFQRRIVISAMTFFDVTLVQSLITNYGYAAVFVVVMLESSGFSVPGKTVLVRASVYAGSRHGLSIGAIIAAAACGAILGDNVGLWVGRRFGRTLLLKHGHRIGINERELILGEYLFQRYGGSIVFFGRFVAFLRVYAGLLAGANRLHLPSIHEVQRIRRHSLGGCLWYRRLCVGPEYAAFRGAAWMACVSRNRDSRIFALVVLQDS